MNGDLRKQLKQAVSDTLRARCYADADRFCQGCGVPLGNGHELVTPGCRTCRNRVYKRERLRADPALKARENQLAVERRRRRTARRRAEALS